MLVELTEFELQLRNQILKNWKNYNPKRIDLGVARTKQQLDIAGRYVCVEKVSSAAAAVTLILNDKDNGELDLVDGLEIITLFKKVFITNAAQAGEWIDIIFGADFRYKKTGQGAGGGGGTEYTEGDVDPTITGPAILGEGPANAITPILVDASGHLQIDILSGGGGITLANNEIQVTWVATDSKSLAAGNNIASDVFTFSTNGSFAHIQLKADNDGVPAFGDTVSFFLLLTCGDPDGAGANEYDTDNHAISLGTLDTNAEDPAIRTVNCPMVKGGMLYAVNNSAGRAITVSACILEKTVS